MRRFQRIFGNGVISILTFFFSHQASIANDSVTVDSGPDQTSTLPVNSTMVAAIVTGGAHESSLWSVTGGDASKVTIESPEKLTSPVSFSAAGVYTLKISVVAGSTISDSLVITILKPTAIYRPDIRIGSNSTTDSHVGNDIYNEEGNGQRLVLKPQDLQPVRFHISIENDGNVSDQISLRGAGISRSRFRVVYLDTTEEPARNVTKQVLDDRYMKEYAPGEIRTFTATVTRRSRAGVRRLIRVNPRFKASSSGAPLKLPDVADAKLFLL